LLIEEIRTIAGDAMIQREFRYRGALHQITVKTKVKPQYGVAQDKN
jgi:hypothetical protein